MLAPFWGMAVFFITAGCGSKGATTTEKAYKDYRTLLDKIRKTEGSNRKEMTAYLSQWRELTDTAVAAIRREKEADKAAQYNRDFLVMSDSIRAELTRVAKKNEWKLEDIANFKTAGAAVIKDKKILAIAEEADRFFSSIPDSKCRKSGAMECSVAADEYRGFLRNNLKKKKYTKKEMLEFLRAEDVLYSHLLQHLHEEDGPDISDITKMTVTCCKRITDAAINGPIGELNAIVYMEKRMNRRLIKNAIVCLNNVLDGKVNDETIERVFMQMAIQPYSAIDGFGVSFLTEKQRKQLVEIATSASGKLQNEKELAGELAVRIIALL